MSEAPPVTSQSRNLIDNRLANQALNDRRFTDPQAVVGWLGAMQAQEFAVTKWSIGQRMGSTTESEISAAIDNGRILRTHVLPPAWHFVAQ